MRRADPPHQIDVQNEHRANKCCNEPKSSHTAKETGFLKLSVPPQEEEPFRQAAFVLNV